MSFPFGVQAPSIPGSIALSTRSIDSPLDCRLLAVSEIRAEFMKNFTKHVVDRVADGIAFYTKFSPQISELCSAFHMNHNVVNSTIC